MEISLTTASDAFKSGSVYWYAASLKTKGTVSDRYIKVKAVKSGTFTFTGQGVNIARGSESIQYVVADTWEDAQSDTSTSTSTMLVGDSANNTNGFSGSAEIAMTAGKTYFIYAQGYYAEDNRKREFYISDMKYTITSGAAVTFSETNTVSANVTVYSDEEKTTEVSPSDLAAGTYYFTATAEGYQDYSDSFEVTADDVAANAKTVTYTMTAKTKAGDVTVNLINSATSEKIDDDAYVSADVSKTYVEDGTIVTVYVPAYYESGNVLYKCDKLSTTEEWSKFSTTASAAGTTYTCSYTALDGTYYYYEADSMNANGAALASGGKVNSDGSGLNVDIFTVSEAGTYKLTVVGTDRGDWYNGKDYSLTVTAGGTEQTEQVTITSSGTIGFKEYTLALSANDVINVASKYSRMGLDYALLQRTGDLTIDDYANDTDLKATVEKDLDAETVTCKGTLSEDSKVSITNSDNSKGGHGFVFVDLTNIATSSLSASESNTTGLTHTNDTSFDDDESGSFAAGESFKVTLTGVPSNATFPGLYAVPYMYQDTTYYWGKGASME